MEFQITREQLDKWCTVPVGELQSHPDKKITSLIMDETAYDSMERFGNMMADEVLKNNREGKATKWVLGASPREQFNTFIERIKKENISLSNLYVFHMDEWLDWEGRYFPYGNHNNCLRGMMDHIFYGRIPQELNVPLEQRLWPNLSDPDEFDNTIENMGGLDTVWAGIGFKGLVAFNESPRDPYHRITIDQYAASKTRIVSISNETVIVTSQRKFGGYTDMIGQMAITIGFKSMLNTKRAVFSVATGAWKHTVLRVLMFSEPTLEYPVTLFPEYVPECILLCDKFTATHPLEDYDKANYNEGRGG